MTLQDMEDLEYGVAVADDEDDCYEEDNIDMLVNDDGVSMPRCEVLKEHVFRQEIVQFKVNLL